tara:strand:- start:692 stop:913 length:222 start_codon:yes stop_codon:yes gene_type:complete
VKEMNIMDVLKRIKSGEKVMVTLPSRANCGKAYSLQDGTDVSREQFCKIEDFLKPSDLGLIPDAEPQSYVWAG